MKALTLSTKTKKPLVHLRLPKSPAPPPQISRLADYYRSEKLEPGYWYVDPAFEYREEVSLENILIKTQRPNRLTRGSVHQRNERLKKIHSNIYSNNHYKTSPLI